MIAVSLDGEYLPELSEQFPALVLQAEAVIPEDETLAQFEDVLDECSETIESLSDTQLQQERRSWSERNLQDYHSERQKQERFFTARLESAEREVRRLETQVREQELSADQNMQHILPATQGRLAIARHHAQQIVDEREQRLRTLDANQDLTYASDLLAAAYLVVEPPLLRS